MKKRKRILSNTIFSFFLISLPTLIILFVILEFFFRFIIVASDPPRSYFYEKDNIYAYDNKRKNGTYTNGKFAQIKTNWHINNFGWNFPIDYVEGNDSGLIAIIGDSYIEAFQVDVDKSYPYLMREKLSPKHEVYSFGVSGAPLSQYLHISRYVNKYFNPEILIFNIIHNDFEESIYEFNPTKKYFLQLKYNEKDNTYIEKTPEPDYSRAQYRPLWQKILYKSAFVRYLYLNLKVNNLKENFKIKHNFEANTCTNVLSEHELIIRKSTEIIVKKIKNESLNKRIIFVFDAPRNAIYNAALEKSDVYFLNIMLSEICAENNIEFIDLTIPMSKNYKKNIRKFNSEIDEHWNEYGHEFVANFLLNYLSIVK